VLTGKLIAFIIHALHAIPM